MVVLRPTTWPTSPVAAARSRVNPTTPTPLDGPAITGSPSIVAAPVAAPFFVKVRSTSTQTSLPIRRYWQRFAPYITPVVAPPNASARPALQSVGTSAIVDGSALT